MVATYSILIFEKLLKWCDKFLSYFSKYIYILMMEYVAISKSFVINYIRNSGKLMTKNCSLWEICEKSPPHKKYFF